MRIPTIKELEGKFKVNFNGSLTITTTENIFFRIMWIDMIIPEWFSSDWASIPKIFRVFINEYDVKWVFAAIVHDYLYRTQFMPRMIADNIFKLILQKTAGKVYCYIFYRWVRLWGFIARYNNWRQLESYPKAKHDLKCYICNNGETKEMMGV